MKIKVSPSLLSQFRDSRLGNYGNDIARVEQMITRKFQPTPAISRGRAYHMLLENGPEKYKVAAKAGHLFRVFEPELKTTWNFSPAAVAPVLLLQDEYRQMVPEVWARFEIHRSGYHVRSNQRLDGINGLSLHEFKTSKTRKGYMDYFPALQWRMNLMALPDLEEVNYHIFRLEDDNSACEYNRFTITKYPGFEDDVLNELDGFLSWIAGRPDLCKRLEW